MSKEGGESKLPKTGTTLNNTPLQKATAPLKPQILPQVLVVDDDPDVLAMVGEFLENQFIVRKASSGHEAMEKIKEHDPQILLTDFRLPDTDGLELIRRALQAKPSMHIFLMTGKGTAHLKDRAFRQGAFRFLEKPLDMNHLLKDLLEIAHKSFGWAGNGIDVLDLTQIMLLCRKNGVVKFGEEERNGFLVFADGELVHASTAEAVGEAAYYAMTLWRECPFQTVLGKRPDLRPNISSHTEGLVLEGARQRDERELQIASQVSRESFQPRQDCAPPIPEEVIRQAKEVLGLLLADDSVHTAMLMDCNGRVVEVASKQADFNPNPLESIIINSVSTSHAMGGRLQFGEMTFSIYEYEKGALLIKTVKDAGLIALLVDTSINLGLIRLQLRKWSSKLEAILE